MKKIKRLFTAIMIIVAVILLAIGGLWLYIVNADYTYHHTVAGSQAILRDQFIATAEKWLGANEDDGTHQPIIDLYNSHTPLAQNYTVQYDDNWCATFVSAAAIQCELTQIIPTECGCQRQIGLFQELGCWVEEDDYTPLPGDIIYYCSTNRDLSGDCTEWSDHVGIVVGTAGPFLKVVEGNYGDKVGYRYLLLDSPTIRGYAVPDYALAAK